ncbi:MAG: LytR C-terminal domain-containing protein [Chitinivibrionales bacterium]|nr:LytR C-terminal domain-containing protein [Chitinivibrionales bacterium]
MRILIVYLLFCTVLLAAIYLGDSSRPARAEGRPTNRPTMIPHIGSVEVLNGCGAAKAANTVAAHLRNHGIDVKSVGNAPYWNYPYTIVVSRVKDMDVAAKVAKILHTDRLIMLRGTTDLFDVSVYIGPDYGELVQ